MIAPDTISLVPSAGRRILFRFLPHRDVMSSVRIVGGRTLPDATIAAEDSDLDKENQGPPEGGFWFFVSECYTFYMQIPDRKDASKKQIEVLTSEQSPRCRHPLHINRSSGKKICHNCGFEEKRTW